MQPIDRRGGGDRRRGIRDGDKTWVGWTEHSTLEAWTLRCRYCPFSISLNRASFDSTDVVTTRASMLRARNALIDHLAMRHLDKALR